MPVPSKGQEGVGRVDPGFVLSGKEPQAHSDPQSSYGWSDGSFHTRLSGHWDTLVTHMASPHVWARHPRRETLVISGSLAFYPASQGAALFIHNLYAHPHPPDCQTPRLTAWLCPEDSGLSGTSKALPSSAGCWRQG